MNIFEIIANELSANVQQVTAAVNLLDEGATVPFIARYRKEATSGLDDTQLRTLEERLGYLRELEERREVVIKNIEEQGKLTAELKDSLLMAQSKTRLEDLYAPYRQKRRTKAQIAREAGLEALLDSLLDNPQQQPETVAEDYLNPDAGFADATEALEGARQIFMERAADEADLVGALREYAWAKGVMTSNVVKGQEQEGRKFADYFDFREKLKKIPSHRALALFRGRSEGVLRLKLIVEGQDELDDSHTMGHCDHLIIQHFKLDNQNRPADRWLQDCARWAWRVKLAMQMETELNLRLREQAEEEAIHVFGENMRDLLLAAPAGARTTLGLDPGLRTGVKVVVVDKTGKLLAQDTIYPHAPKNQWDASIATLEKLCKQHKVELLSIGNGTASRETDKLAKALISQHPELKLASLVVSEAGASVYSASAYAAKEFPELDVSLRGAVSIARRLQDPLAELVKIEPRSIGVGQYQHDVNQSRLSRKLDAIVEDCVNAVGVEVNTASAPLLANVAGLSESLANNIVSYREQHGAFKNRKELLKVSRLGPKAFEQAAGFMRIANGENPLDASAVHPEAYPLVERILKQSGRKIDEVMGDSSFLSSLAVNDFIDENFGEPTVRDVINELDKPGRDPRPEFKTACFKEGVEKLTDLKEAMILEGVVTNVTNFGAFVDIGVHQDGLVHISVLADRFVKDPREVVRTGDVVKVKVLEVDATRKRIALSMRMTDDVARKQGSGKANKTKPARRQSRDKNAAPQKIKPKRQPDRHAPASAMAQAFAKLKA